MDKLTGLAVFARVVENGSFAAAARHFGLSPAMVSKHVQALEDGLGVRLLNRTTRQVNPTEAGRGFYERCRHILAELEEAERAAAAAQTAPRGLLRISAPVSFGAIHIAPAIADYLARYPEVMADVQLNDRYVDLIEEGIDVALRVGRLADSSLVARRLVPIRTAVCAAPAYLLRHGAPREPRDLTAHNCLLYSYSTTGEEWHFTSPDGEPIVVRVRGRLHANNGEVLRAAALAGEGIMKAPSFAIGAEIAAGRLVPLLPDYAPREIALHALYPHSRHLSVKVRSFVDFLAARFGKEPEWDRWLQVSQDELRALA